AKMGQILAHDGIDPYSQKEIIPMSIARMAKALMVTCIMPQEILLHMLDFQLKAVCREGLLLLYLRVFKMKRSHFCKDVGLVFMVKPSIKKGIACEECVCLEYKTKYVMTVSLYSIYRTVVCVH